MMAFIDQEAREKAEEIEAKVSLYNSGLEKNVNFTGKKIVFPTPFDLFLSTKIPTFPV